MLDGRDVTDAIRAETVERGGIPGRRQRAGARRRCSTASGRSGMPPGLVADGRDMGSVVFPDAALKIFLTASPEERAARRYKQLMEKGMSATYGRPFAGDTGRATNATASARLPPCRSARMPSCSIPPT